MSVWGCSPLTDRCRGVRYEVDYLARLWFRDLVDIEIRVASVGRSSVRYEFTVLRGDVIAAVGALVAVHSDPAVGGKTPWPDHVRSALLESGDQTPELLVG